MSPTVPSSAIQELLATLKKLTKTYIHISKLNSALDADFADHNAAAQDELGGASETAGIIAAVERAVLMHEEFVKLSTVLNRRFREVCAEIEGCEMLLSEVHGEDGVAEMVAGLRRQREEVSSAVAPGAGEGGSGL